MRKKSDIIYSSKLLSRVSCFISRIKNHGFLKEVSIRSHISIFDYRIIAKPLPKYYQEICTDNNCFGIGYNIRKYAGYKKPYINGWIEHGYFFADIVSDLAKISFTNSIITFGNHRKEVNNRFLPQKDCYKIGPYVHYASDYISEEDFIKLKEELGRVLLVFPLHAGSEQQVHYEKKELFKLVESVSAGFDTILFSLFWSDISDDYVSEIEKRGYKIVCSGHRYDPYFLSRQKTIIKLADVTMSNGLGTNLVYCTFYKKPHWLIHQKKEFKSLGKGGDMHIEFINNNMNKYRISPKLYEAFKDYNDVLTEEQYNLCSKLFGFEDIKTPNEMLKLLVDIEKQ